MKARRIGPAPRWRRSARSAWPPAERHLRRHTGGTAGRRRARHQDRHQVRPARPRPEDGLDLQGLRRRRRDVHRRQARLRRRPDRVVQAPIAQRETLISTGQVDLIVGTYSITDERKEKVSFAGPYFIAGQDLLVRSDDTSITGPDTLDGKKLCSVTGSTSAQNIKDKYPGVNLQEFGTYSECVAALSSGTSTPSRPTTRSSPATPRRTSTRASSRSSATPSPTENYGVGLKKGDTALCQKVTDAHQGDDRRRRVAEVRRRQPRPGGLQAGSGQPADPGRLRLTVRADPGCRSRAGCAGGVPRTGPAHRKRPGGRHPRATYDILGAFWVTIQLTVLSAIGALVIGTVFASCGSRPSPCSGCIGTRYVNIFRNTPLTLLIVVQHPRADLHPRASASPTTSPQQLHLGRHHAVRLPRRLRLRGAAQRRQHVPVGQAEAARSIGLTFGQSLREVLLPQAFRGAIARSATPSSR